MHACPEFAIFAQTRAIPIQAPVRAVVSLRLDRFSHVLCFLCRGVCYPARNPIRFWSSEVVFSFLKCLLGSVGLGFVHGMRRLCVHVGTTFHVKCRMCMLSNAGMSLWRVRHRCCDVVSIAEAMERCAFVCAHSSARCPASSSGVIVQVAL